LQEQHLSGRKTYDEPGRRLCRPGSNAGMPMPVGNGVREEDGTDRAPRRA